MPSVYILPANEKNQKGEEGGRRTHARGTHSPMHAPDFSIFLERREREREILSSSRFISKKKFFPIIKRTITQMSSSRFEYHRIGNQVVEIFIPMNFSRDLIE